MTSLVYKGDIGTRLQIDTLNHTMATTTTFTIIIKKPSGVIMNATPTSFNYTTGVASYDCVAGDLDEVGDYQIQLLAVYADGDILKSNRNSFPVYEVVE